MLINTLTTETGNQVLLIDQVFGTKRLNQLHAMCAEFTPGCKHWPQPDWCGPPHNRPRFLFDEKGDEWAELVQFFDSDEFKVEFFGNFFQLWKPSHGAIFIHDFYQSSCRV